MRTIRENLEDSLRALERGYTDAAAWCIMQALAQLKDAGKVKRCACGTAFTSFDGSDHCHGCRFKEEL